MQEVMDQKRLELLKLPKNERVSALFTLDLLEPVGKLFGEINPSCCPRCTTRLTMIVAAAVGSVIATTIATVAEGDRDLMLEGIDPFMKHLRESILKAMNDEHGQNDVFEVETPGPVSHA
jgi:hypothetical protein